MTALNPRKGLEVRGIAATRYEPNTVCAHPDCDKPTDSVHHIFGRPPGDLSDSWFVQATDVETGESKIIPHAIGLCGSGTTGHHGDVEEHRGWIQLQDDGKYVWYTRDVEVAKGEDEPPADDGDPWQENMFGAWAREAWVKVGLLIPQPGVKGGGKKKKARFKGEARRKRKTISIRVPQDEQEDGAGILDDALLMVEEIIYEGDPEAETFTPRPPYYTIMDALNYVILNEK